MHPRGQATRIPAVDFLVGRRRSIVDHPAVIMAAAQLGSAANLKSLLIVEIWLTYGIIIALSFNKKCRRIK
jgi:hypothetical protein